MNRSEGFSMVEVLVSVVILSIALLGTAGLMGSSLRNTNTAYYRSQATVLADDMFDRMRANLTAARDGEYAIASGPAYAAADGTVARFDCEEWIETLQTTHPGGDGEIEIDGDAVVTITIKWDNNESSFMTESRL
jgi:type IV pilus assembly protein PilV